MGRRGGPKLVVMLIIAGTCLIGVPRAGAGDVAPRLSKIIAIFAPPIESKPVTAWCDGVLPPPSDNDVRKDIAKNFPPLSPAAPCTTYYFVQVPKQIGPLEDVKVEWTLESVPGSGKPLCGTFSGDHAAFVRKKALNRRVYYATWFHPHPDQITSAVPCNDLYPHEGRRIRVDVISKRWLCSNVYELAAAGTDFPDTSGRSGGKGKPCEKPT